MLQRKNNKHYMVSIKKALQYVVTAIDIKICRFMAHLNARAYIWSTCLIHPEGMSVRTIEHAL